MHPKMPTYGKPASIAMANFTAANSARPYYLESALKLSEQNTQFGL